MFSGSQPMPPEQVAEELEEAEEVDRDAVRRQVMLEAAAREGSELNSAEAAALDGIEERPGLIERLLDLVDGDPEPEPGPAEA
jgi:hypothetical protein